MRLSNGVKMLEARERAKRYLIGLAFAGVEPDGVPLWGSDETSMTRTQLNEFISFLEGEIGLYSGGEAMSDYEERMTNRDYTTMSIDILMYIKTSDGRLPNVRSDLPSEATVSAVGPYDVVAVPEATHKINLPYRYYAPGYENGPWAKISAVLMELLATANVEAVWYFGDHDYTDDPFTPVRVAEYSMHFMTDKWVRPCDQCEFDN